MLTVQLILAILALLMAAVSPTGYVPLWVAVILLSVLAILQYSPLAR